MQEYSDFNLDYSRGFELAMPQLNQLRLLAKSPRPMRREMAMATPPGLQIGWVALPNGRSQWR
jgi:hypothetical protein